MISSGFEPETDRVLGDRDNQLHHETVMFWREPPVRIYS